MDIRDFDDRFREKIVADLTNRGDATTRIARLSKVVGLWLADDGAPLEHWETICRAAAVEAIADELFDGYEPNAN